MTSDHDTLRQGSHPSNWRVLMQTSKFLLFPSVHKSQKCGRYRVCKHEQQQGVNFLIVTTKVHKFGADSWNHPSKIATPIWLNQFIHWLHNSAGHSAAVSSSCVSVYFECKYYNFSVDPKFSVCEHIFTLTESWTGTTCNNTKIYESEYFSEKSLFGDQWPTLFANPHFMRIYNR